MNNDEIIKAQDLAKHFGIAFIQLREISIPDDLLAMIPEDVARRNRLVIYKKDQKDGRDHFYIAVAEPERLQKKAPDILTKLKKEKNASFTLAITTPDDLDYALLGYKQKNKFTKTTVNTAEEESVITSGNISTKTISLKSFGDIPFEILSKFPENVARKYQLIVFAEPEEDKRIKVAMADPDNIQTQEILDFIEERNKIQIEQYKTSESDILWALSLYEKNKPQPKPEIIPQFTLKDKLNQVGKENTEIAKKPMDESITKFHDQIKTPIEPSIELAQKQLAKPTIKIQQTQKLEINPEEINGAEIREMFSDNNVPPPTGYNGKVIAPKFQSVISETDQNLDLILPAGVRDTADLALIIKGGMVPKIVAAIIYLAVGLEASDIHFEVDVNSLHIRYRIDGELKDIIKAPLSLQAPIISRIKILSKLKIDEQRIPQDGRFSVGVFGREIDLRVSTLPTIHGEKSVLRILDKTTGLITLGELGLEGSNSKLVFEAIAKPYGIILVTGPTGSGKTTTLYAMLKKINTSKINIITLEDPVEYELEGINQCQIKPKIGFGFAEGLRSILRQDPNVIMVGEIRDTETANMATHAALTGHLVFSTLHTNDAAGALPRLIDMGVEPYLITSSVNCIIAQRLVRKLCPACKSLINLPIKLVGQIKEELSSSVNPEIKKYTTDELKFYGPKGCSKCKDGYKGRAGLFEVLEVNNRIEQLTVNRATGSVIHRAALNNGMITMRQDGFVKALRGITSVDEVIRVTIK